MDCREAQSLFTGFIDRKLDIDKMESFIKHIETCSDCRDEIEVYFIVYSGIRQLDNEEEDISDFKAAFQKLIQEKKNEIRLVHRQRMRKRVVGTVLISLIFILSCAAAILYVIDREHFTKVTEYAQTSFAKNEGAMMTKHVEYTLDHNKWQGEAFKAIVHNTKPKESSEKTNENEQEDTKQIEKEGESTDE